MDKFNVTVNEREEREEILSKVRAYCEKYHTKPAYKEGDRIPYASRVYDSEEMCNLVDSALDFWLTAGRYAGEFETEFAKYSRKKALCWSTIQDTRYQNTWINMLLNIFLKAYFSP